MDIDGLERSIEDNTRLLKEHTPSLGTEFESKEIAYQFYNEYGRIMRFSIRRDYHTKSKKDGIMVTGKFVCYKEGEKDKQSEMVKQPQQHTRTNCKAFLYVSLDRELSKWVITKFDDTHNHIMHLPQCAHTMPSQRKVSEAQSINMELADAIGLLLKASHDFISTQAGGGEFVGFMREDQKSYLRVK
ncbi:protein FAR1-RELATED SEQUENCE 5-like [Camellia sinensis]|uniref:protein FAR1-RELATED SEQUENCE 5-like n=1 Tax=Camellia sinensis TaxID=4442 RepID=UPI00103648DE|nr:protein FAR1-RELATED SEQUENCE 5-like [Camellia sinensis]